MAYKQPRVPELHEGVSERQYLKALIPFLKEFALSAWKADTQREKEIGSVSYPVTSVNGETGDVVLSAEDVGARADTWTPSAQDVGALPADGTAADSGKLGGVDAGDYALKTDLPEDSGADFLSIYPVGSVYISTSTTSPAGLFGGTWEMLKNRFLIGAGGSYTNGGTGGKTGYALRAAIGAINSDPSCIGYCYTSAMTYQKNATSARYGLDASSETISSWNHSTIVTEQTGTSSTTTIIPPYLAVCMWERIA